MKVIRSIPAVLVLMCSGTYAQQPRIVNANVQTRSAAGGLEREFRSLLSGQAEPAWLGWFTIRSTRPQGRRTRRQRRRLPFLQRSGIQRRQRRR